MSHRAHAQQTTHAHRSRPAQSDMADEAGEATVTVTQAELDRMIDRKLEMRIAARDATDPGPPKVLVVGREIPEGLAGSWLAKKGYYPDRDGVQELRKLYLKHQPSLVDLPDLTQRIGTAVRNTRAHLSRQLKDALPDLFRHEVSELSEEAVVRCVCVVSYLILHILRECEC